MRRRSRTRRVAKWVGTCLTVLILVAALISLRFTVSCWSRSGDGVGWLATGQLELSLTIRTGHKTNTREALPRALSGVRITRSTGPLLARWRWRPYARSHSFAQGETTLFVWIPLWLPFVICALPSCLLWWLDRRRTRAGFCVGCGYDLTGNVSGRCPECGTPIGVLEVPQHSRARRVAKWAGLGLCGGLLAAWLTSLKWCVVYGFEESHVRLTDGTLRYLTTGLTTRRWRVLDVWGTSSFCLPDVIDVDRAYQHFVLPLWSLLLIVALPSAYLWWVDYRVCHRIERHKTLVTV
jgi:hypothetical protein